jgi:hypothetical protein
MLADTEMNTDVTPDLEPSLQRAQLLLLRSIEQLELEQQRKKQHSAAAALKLQRLQSPLQQLQRGLIQLLKAMSVQPNPSEAAVQRWQGELQALLITVDGTVLELEEGLDRIEQPVAGTGLPKGPVPKQSGPERPTPLEWQRLQAELNDLRSQLFARESESSEQA